MCTKNVLCQNVSTSCVVCALNLGIHVNFEAGYNL